MNRCYRLVWNRNSEKWVVAHEHARSRGKRSGTLRLVNAAVAAAFAGFAATAHALPTGGQVSAGTGSIAQSGTAMTVTQGTHKLAVNWNSFGIGADESVTFKQPDSSAIALNRVLGTDPSQIYGRLSANGQVFLLNPNGLLFGPGAQVNVGGLVASTLNLSDSDFMAGRYSFAGNGGSVLNQGTISAADGGYVALLGAQVSNEGTVQARLGTVALAAGRKVTLDFAGDSLVSLQVDEGVVDALAQNKQLIRADGGTALLTAKAAGALEAAVVNNSGVVEAQTIENHGGVIRLLGDPQNGVAQVGGTLDASAPNGGDGGLVETSAAKVQVADGAVVTTAAPEGHAGTWLIDPKDFTIGASGDMTGADLSSNLASGNITIESSGGLTDGSGNINVDEPVSWATGNALTLNASNDINVNSGITATDPAAALNLHANSASGIDPASGTGSVNIVNNTVNVAGTVDVTGFNLNVGSPSEFAPSLLQTGDLNATLAGGMNVAAGTGPGVTATVRSSGVQSISVGTNLVLSGGEGTNSTAMIQSTGSGAQSVFVGGSITATAGGNSSNGSGNKAYILKGGSGVQTVSAHSVHLAGGGGSAGAENKAAILTAPGSSASQQVFIGAGGLTVVGGGGAGAGNTAGVWVLDDYPSGFGTTSSQVVNVAGNVSITGGAGDVTSGHNNASIFQSSTGAGASQTVNVGGSITLTGAASGISGGAYITSNAPSQAVSANGIAINGGGGTDGTNDAAGIVQNNAGGAQSVTVNGSGALSLTGGSGSGGWNTAQIYSVGSGAQTINFASGGAINLTGGTGVIDSAAGSSNNAKIETTAGNQTISGLPSITIQGGTDGGSSGGSTNLGNFALIRADSGAQTIDAGAISLAIPGSGTSSSATIQGPMQTINASSVTLSGGGSVGPFSGVRIGGHGGSVGGPTNLTLNTSGPITLTGGTTAGASIGSHAGWATNITINSGGDVTLTPGTGSGVLIGAPSSGLVWGNISIVSQGDIRLGQTGGIGSAINTGGNVSLYANAPGGSIIEQPASVIRASELTTVSDSGTVLQGANQVGGFGATNSTGGDIVLNDSMPGLIVRDVWNAAPGGALSIANSGATDVTGNVFTSDGGDLTLAAGGYLHVGNPSTGISVVGGSSPANTGNLTLSGADIGIDGGNGGGVVTYIGLKGSGTEQVTTPGDLTIAATASPNGSAVLRADDGAAQVIDVGGYLQLWGGEGSGNAATIEQYGSGGQTVTVGGAIVATAGGNSSNGVGNNAQIFDFGSAVQTVSAGTIALTGGGGASGAGNIARIMQANAAGAQSVTVNGSDAINITGGSGSGGANFAQIFSAGSGPQTIHFTSGGQINLTGGSGAIDSGAATSNFARIEATSGDQSITGMPWITIQGGSGGTDYVDGKNLGNFAFIRADSGLQAIDAGAITLTAGASGINNSASIQGPTQVINASSVALNGGGGSGGYAGARIGGRGGLTGGPTNLTLTTTGPIALTGGATTGVAIGANPSGGGPTEITINSGGDVILTPGAVPGVRIGSPLDHLDGGDISITSQGSIVLNHLNGIGSGIYTAGDVSLTANALGGRVVASLASVIVANALTTVSDAGTFLRGANQVRSFSGINYSGNSRNGVIFYDDVPALDVTGIRNYADGGNVYVSNSGDMNVTGDVFAAGRVFATSGGDLSLIAGGDLLIGNSGTATSVTDGTDWTNSGNMTLSGTNIGILGGNGVFNTFVALWGSGTQQVTTPGNLAITATASPNGAAYLSANDSATQSISVGGNLALSGGDGVYNQAIIMHDGTGAQNISAGSITLSGGEGANSSAMIMQNGSGVQAVAAGGSIVATAGGNSSNGFGNNAYIVDNGGVVQTVSAGSIALAGGGGASGASNTAGISQNNLAGRQLVAVNNGGSITITGGSGSGGANFAQIFSRGIGTQTIAFGPGGAISLTGGSGAPVSTAGTSNFARIEATAGDQTITGAPSITIQGGIDGSDMVGTTNLGNFAFIRADSGLQSIDAGAIALTAGGSGINNSATIQGVQQVINASSVALSGGGAGGTFSGARIGGRGGATGGPTNLTLTTTGSITLTGGSASGAGIGDNPSGGGPTEISINAGGDVTLQPGTGAGVRIGSTAGNLQSGNISISSQGNITLGQNGAVGSGIYTSGDVSLTTYAGSILEQPASRILAGTLSTASGAGTLLDGVNQVAGFNAANTTSGNIVLNDAAPDLSVGSVWNAAPGGAVNIGNTGGIDVTGFVSTADGGDLTLAAGGDLLIGSAGSGASVVGGMDSANTGNMTLSGANIGIFGGSASYGSYVALNGSGTQIVTTPGDLTLQGGEGTGNGAILAANNSVTQTVTAGGAIVATAGGNTSSGSLNNAYIQVNGSGSQTVSANSIALTGGGGVSGANNSAAIMTSPSASGSQQVTVGTGGLVMQGGTGSGSGNKAGIWVLDDYATNHGTSSAQTLTVAGNIALTGGSNADAAVPNNNNASIFQSSTGGGATQSVSADGGITLTGGASGANGGAYVSSSAPNQSVNAGSGGIALRGGGGLDGLNDTAAIVQNNAAGAQSVTVSGGGAVSLTGGSGSRGSNNAGIYSQGSGPQTIAFGAGGALSVTGGTGVIDSTAGASNYARIYATAGDQSITGAPSITLQGGSGGGTSGGSAILGNFALIRADTGMQSIDAGVIALAGGASGIDNSASIQGATQAINATSVTLDGGGASGSFSGVRIGGHGGYGVGPTNLTLNTTGPVTLTGGTDTGGASIGANRLGGVATDITINSGGDVTLTPGTGAGVHIGSPASNVAGGNISVTSQGNITLGQTGGVGSGIHTLGDVSLTANAPGGSIVEQGASAIRADSLTTASDAGTLLGGANRVTGFNATNATSGNVSLVNTADPLTISGITNYGGDISVDNTGAIITTGPISAPAGSVSIVAHSPLTIGSAGVTAGGDVILSAGQTADPGDSLVLNGPVASTGNGSILLYAGDDLLQNANVSSNGGSVSATAEDGSITMAAGTSTASGGGTIGYAAPSGDINLSSLDAGAGAINLDAGGNVQPTAGSTGINLIGYSADVTAGGDVTLTTQLTRPASVTAGGTTSVTNVRPCKDDDCDEDEHEHEHHGHHKHHHHDRGDHDRGDRDRGEDGWKTGWLGRYLGWVDRFKRFDDKR